MMVGGLSGDYFEGVVLSNLRVHRVLAVIQQGHYPVIPTVTKMENVNR